MYQVQNESIFFWGLARDLPALKRSLTLRLDDDQNLLSNFFLECVSISCDVLISDIKCEGLDMFRQNQF